MKIHHMGTKSVLKYLLLFGIALLLTACGGGGSSSGSDDRNVEESEEGSSPIDNSPAQNLEPQIQVISDFVLEQGVSLDLTVLATDPDDDELSFTTDNLPSFILFTDNGNNSATLLFNGVHTEGVYTISIVVSDGDKTAIRQFVVTVPAVNSPPIIETIAGVSPDEIGVLEFEEGRVDALQINISDPDGDELTVSLKDVITSLQPNFIGIIKDLQGDTQITFSPAAGDSGSYTLYFSVNDGSEQAGSTIEIIITEPYSGLVSDIDTGAYHTCALEDGKVWCWGLNDQGQSNVPQDLGHVTHIAIGSHFSCAADENGVQCWGHSSAGETSVPEIEGDILKLSAGYIHACALTDVELVCWGGDSVFTHSAKGQADVPDDLGTVSDVSSGGFHTCVISDGTPRCWGSNNSGQIIEPSLGGAIDLLAVGRLRSCVYGEDGLNCWGWNVGYDQDGPPADLGVISKLDIGFFAVTCAIVGGDVVCWGEGGEGFGWPSFNAKNIPLDLGVATDIAVGDAHACALDETGVHCWGAGKSGEDGEYDYHQSDVPARLRTR